MTTVEEATCSSLWPRTVFDGESGLLSCTEKLLQFYCSGRVSSTANETWRCTLHSCRSFKTRGNAWCREGKSNPQDPKVGGF